MSHPLLLGMFHRQIEGDHHLLELAQRHFTHIKLGAEFYPTSLNDLQTSLEFRPLTEHRYTMHLPRSLNLLHEGSRKTILSYAKRGRTDAYGMIIHDQAEMATNPPAYIKAIQTINAHLLKINPSPYLFIEYAAGLELDTFASIFEAVADCERVSACIDISHVGIRQSQRAYAELYPSEDVCLLSPGHPALTVRIDDVVTTTATALPAVLTLIKRLAKLDKPLHFHLHDGHPISTFSPYGVNDHLSFYRQIKLPFKHKKKNVIPLLFGQTGLEKIINTALDTLSAKKLSFMLEIHPQYNSQYEQLALGEYESLFQNWNLLRNAEQMNAWLEEISKNAQLLQKLCVKRDA
ncbi:hypothetical protein QUF64_09265 [Anaerolineales bacterium HSG6]|nr:hypothetical protein [Anaerolineales bacterium HSG6]MDM8531155.1 hypothetical protein [Anaerolineales bacterium HSG25]